MNAVEEAMELQATDYLVKPVSLRKLRRKIEDALINSSERIEISPEQAGPLEPLAN